jgi:5'(3')-deoxyribonucleotidase
MSLQSNRLKIALDLDGVLADTMETFCMLLNARMSGLNLTPESFNRWNAWEVANITKQEFLRILDEAWFNWRDIPPVEKDLDKKVSNLVRFGRVDIVTGRSEVTVPFAKEWLRSNSIPYEKFVRTVSTTAKADLDYDIFIDDSDHLMSLLASRLYGFGMLYEQPWNRQAKNMPRIFKISKWHEIPPLIENICG